MIKMTLGREMLSKYNHTKLQVEQEIIGNNAWEIEAIEVRGMSFEGVGRVHERVS